MTCTLNLCEIHLYKGSRGSPRRLLHREVSGHCFPLPQDGGRADGRREFGGCFATRWRSSDQCQSRPGRALEKKNLGLCSFCIPGATRVIIALTGLCVRKSLSAHPGRSRWDFSMELKFPKNNETCEGKCFIYLPCVEKGKEHVVIGVVSKELEWA